MHISVKIYYYFIYSELLPTSTATPPLLTCKTLWGLIYLIMKLSSVHYTTLIRSLLRHFFLLLCQLSFFLDYAALLCSPSRCLACFQFLLHYIINFFLFISHCQNLFRKSSSLRIKQLSMLPCRLAACLPQLVGFSQVLKLIGRPPSMNVYIKI